MGKLCERETHFLVQFDGRQISGSQSTIGSGRYKRCVLFPASQCKSKAHSGPKVELHLVSPGRTSMVHPGPRMEARVPGTVPVQSVAASSMAGRTSSRRLWLARYSRWSPRPGRRTAARITRSSTSGKKGRAASGVSLFDPPIECVVLYLSCASRT